LGVGRKADDLALQKKLLQNPKKRKPDSHEKPDYDYCLKMAVFEMMIQ
jgi:hypothetical protein